MKFYFRLSPHTVEMELQAIELWWQTLKDKLYPTFTAIRIDNRLINLRNQSEYDANINLIEKIIADKLDSMITTIHSHNVLTHCELDNIIEIDDVSKQIHIWYADEFF